MDDARTDADRHCTVTGTVSEWRRGLNCTVKEEVVKGVGQAIL